MHDGKAHQILAQVPLTVSPFINLPVATTLPYTYKALPTSLPASSTNSGPPGAQSSAPPQYVISQSGHAAHPDEIIASCQALQAHLAKMQEDSRNLIKGWENGIVERELAEKRRVAPGWLDREERILQPERRSIVPGDSGETITAEESEEAKELDRAFSSMQICLLSLVQLQLFTPTMPLQITSAAPADDSFVPLEDHQSETPSTFFSETPVLHFHDKHASIVISKSHLASLPIFSTPAPVESETKPTQNGESQDATDEVESQISIPDIAIWVTSKFVELFNSAVSKGVKIPYLSISLHAIQTITPPGSTDSRKAIYMQLSLSTLSDGENQNAIDEGAYDDEDVLELSIVPGKPFTDEASSKDSAEELFNALSVCSNLNPDEPDSDEEPAVFSEGDYNTGSNDGLPPPFPGSGGWITAENVNEFFDADGNWLGRENQEEQDMLGEGAGRVRERDEDETEDATSAESKWRRTD